jgi:hypothetical protein
MPGKSFINPSHFHGGRAAARGRLAPEGRNAMSRFSYLLVLGLVVWTAAAARAQVFYEPVQYQYGTTQKFYYGGSDPRVFAFAQRAVQIGRWSRVTAQPGRYGLPSEDFQPVNPRISVYADPLPALDAADYGNGISDARNQAYANVPRYFHKRDLLATGILTPDGLVVPAQAQPRQRPAWRRRAEGIQPGMILILPHRPTPAKPDMSLVDASRSATPLAAIP